VIGKKPVSDSVNVSRRASGFRSSVAANACSVAEREERQQSGPPERPTATRPLDVLELFGDAIRNAGAVGVVDRAGSGRPVGGRCVFCHS